jgi:hypothetical protein
MQDLLLKKLNKTRGRRDQFIIGDTGDLQLKDGAQQPITDHVNLADDPPTESDNDDQVDDDEEEETDKGTGKQGLAIIATGSPFSSSKIPVSSSKTPVLRSKTASTSSKTVSSAGRKREAKANHRDTSNKKAKVADNDNKDIDSDLEEVSALWDLSNKNLDTMINELDALDGKSGNLIAEIDSCFEVGQRCHEVVQAKCALLKKYTDKAVALTKDLRAQRIKAETDKKNFHECYVRAYLATHRQYLDRTRLLLSSAWWQQGLDQQTNERQQEALEKYYSGIHPFCTLIRRVTVPSSLSPTEPHVTIERSGLLSLEDTSARMDSLFAVDDKTLKGTSLLQLPSILQDKLVQEGEWPEDGICLPDHLSDELTNKISKSRSSFAELHFIPEQLMLTNAGVTKSRGSESSIAVQGEAVAAVPGAADKV